LSAKRDFGGEEHSDCQARLMWPCLILRRALAILNAICTRISKSYTQLAFATHRAIWLQPEHFECQASLWPCTIL